jgi:uncharacterized lipoprotein YmbA
MMREVPLVLTVVAAILVSDLFVSCSSTPASSFYTLGPDKTLASTGAPASVRVVISPVTIPDIVDRPQIVTRLPGAQVQLNEFARWAAPLRSDIARVIAADVSELLGSESVNVFDYGPGAGPAWRVRVDVTRFDSAPGDAVTIEALWAVRPPGKSVPVLGHSLAHEPVEGQGYDALVAAHDRALGAVSRDIASAIRTNLSQ